MPKKVLILTNNSDGLYRFRNELIRELIRDYEVVASTPFDNFVPELEGLCSKLIKTDIDRRGMNPIKDCILLVRYKKIINYEKPDYVITYTIKPNIYGSIICRIKKIPYAVNITGLGSAFEKKGMIQSIVEGLYKIALKQSKVVFFENSEDRNEFVKRNIVIPQRTCVLNGAGINTKIYSYQQYPNNEKVVFLFIGRVMKEKGIDELLEAGLTLVVEGMKFCLKIVGPCEENYLEVLRKYEQDGWLKYYGFQTDVKQFIKACDCFVLPSYHEGMANTNLECASSGRPLITSNIPGCKESVLEGKSGFLCEPKDVESLYISMKNMIMLSREKREEMGRIGRKHMITVFDKKKVVKDTIKHLQC